MNEQDFRDRFNSADSVESTDKDTNSPFVNSDPLADKFPVDTAPIHETPMSGTVEEVGSMDEKIVHEAPMDEAIFNEAPMDEKITHKDPISTNVGSSETLLSREESEQFRTRWNEIQGKFVDEPRAAVEQADVLVSEVIEQITQMFATEHSSLEGQWSQGNEVSTEDLRIALQRYRSFFNRLVV
ncbi:MAG TPA: hypothetical protein VLM80_02795 [Anaerolineales bacterium]|nr:hypothetical protein [Anaerolineales bacterium]